MIYPDFEKFDFNKAKPSSKKAEEEACGKYSELEKQIVELLGITGKKNIIEVIELFKKILYDVDGLQLLIKQDVINKITEFYQPHGLTRTGNLLIEEIKKM